MIVFFMKFYLMGRLKKLNSINNKINNKTSHRTKLTESFITLPNLFFHSFCKFAINKQTQPNIVNLREGGSNFQESPPRNRQVDFSSLTRRQQRNPECSILN